MEAASDRVGNVMDVLEAIADVLEAGAKRSAQWCYNVDRMQEAEVLQAMADEARRIARREE